jgi:PleD family two-component response regulator
MTVSIGSAGWREEDVTRLLEQADQALYRAKGAGRDKAVAA